jgi:hypothetical protein
MSELRRNKTSSGNPVATDFNLPFDESTLIPHSFNNWRESSKSLPDF